MSLPTVHSPANPCPIVFTIEGNLCLKYTATTATTISPMTPKIKKKTSRKPETNVANVRILVTILLSAKFHHLKQKYLREYLEDVGVHIHPKKKDEFVEMEYCEMLFWLEMNILTRNCIGSLRSKDLCKWYHTNCGLIMHSNSITNGWLMYHVMNTT